jgi:hypothetical protein
MKRQAQFTQKDSMTEKYIKLRKILAMATANLSSSE